MENNLGDEKITVREIVVAFLAAYKKVFYRKIFYIPAILLLPIIFAISVFNIRNWGSHLGFFYMRPELPTLITVILFPLTWIFLGIRKNHRLTAKRFAGVTASILLLCLSVSTAMETASIAPLDKIDKAVTTSLASEGWVRDNLYDEFRPGSGLIPVCFYLSSTNQHPPCPEIYSYWSKEQDAPLSFSEFQKIAADNGLTDSTDAENCRQIGKDSSSNSCHLSGTIDGRPAELSYSGNHDYGESNPWELHISLRLR